MITHTTEKFYSAPPEEQEWFAHIAPADLPAALTGLTTQYHDVLCALEWQRERNTWLTRQLADRQARLDTLNASLARWAVLLRCSNCGRGWYGPQQTRKDPCAACDEELTHAATWDLACQARPPEVRP